ncbi:MAG TPA: hypothetical protein VJ179_01765, partial [Patescibacteria group bacterium]|nr:hypothetical protein [Patescibacteria group bacterium]
MTEKFIADNFHSREAVLLDEARQQIEEGLNPTVVYNQLEPTLTALSESMDQQSTGGSRRVDPGVKLRNLLRQYGWHEHKQSSPLGAAD